MSGADDYAYREVLDQATGVAHRFYTYKRKPCHRVVLSSKIAAQLEGYTLIEKDLRSAVSWVKEIETLHTDGARLRNESYGRGKDRHKYILIKGLFVAALTFYGKCFSKCDGRPVKLERAQLDSKYHDLHDTCIRFRHNFAAHSGAEKLERVDVVLVVPRKRKAAAVPRLYTELWQPDVLWPTEDEVSFEELFEHVRAIASNKVTLLNDKIMSDEVLPKGQDYWLSRPGG